MERSQHRVSQRVFIIGGGFVGVTTATALAELGHEVVLVERDAKRRAHLERGILPFFEADLGVVFDEQKRQGAIDVRGDIAGSRDADVVMLCVGTPQGSDGSADLSQVFEAATAVAATSATVQRPPLLAIKSTVPPGTADRVRKFLEEAGHGGARLAVASVPEFLREGSALMDARHPDRVIIGVSSHDAEGLLRSLFAGLSTQVLVTDPTTAEMIKYASNGFLASKVAFVNEIASLCEVTGIDVDDVMKGVGMDTRIGPAFLSAGPGFGGSCFPKDLHALRALGRDSATPVPVIDAVLQANDMHPKRVVEMARSALGGLTGKRIALLGLAFKAGTSDVRESRALPIYETLREHGAEVRCHDPEAASDFRRMVPDAYIVDTVDEALRDCDGCIVQVAWPVYQDIAPEDFKRLMRRPLVIDTRRCLRGAMDDEGVDYRALGVGRAVEVVQP